MRLGEQPDPRIDRARRLLSRCRGRIGHRWPLLALLVLILLVAGTVMAGLLVVVDDDPRLSNPPEKVLGLVLHRVGLVPEDTLLIVSGIKYVNIGLPGNIVRGMLSKPEQTRARHRRARLPAPCLRAGEGATAGVLDPVR